MNLDDIKKELTKQKLDALLVTSGANIIYLTGYTNFSKDEREAYLLITKTQQYIFTDARYSEAIKQNVAHFTLEEISSSQSLKDILTLITKSLDIKRLGIEEHDLKVNEFVRLKKMLKGVSIIPTKDIIENKRIIKSHFEIKQIEKACELGDLAFTHVIKLVKEGVSEKELSFELEFYIKKNGGDISFSPIVAFGKNAAIPHHQTGNKKLTKNNFVLFDFGAKIQGYCSDMTRTFFYGKATDEQKTMYETVLAAQLSAIDYLNSSVKTPLASTADEKARLYILDKGYPSIPHSLGHGIGVEVHESPTLSPNSQDTLRPGMVFSIEPGIYISRFGGVRIEDLAVKEKNGIRLLTHSPKNLIEIE